MKKFLIIALIGFIAFLQGKAQSDLHPYEWPTDSLVSSKLNEWQDWKFGIIIHWGAYSEWGVVESWSLCPEDEPWCERRGQYGDDYFAYERAYENIRRRFYPDNFNPEGWAKAAKDAGMRYVVFTTKHHDGFCMFNSKLTDYKITDAGSRFSSDPRSNITKEVFNAFSGQGLAIGAYFSKPDWHNNDYWWPKFPPLDRNVNYNPVKYPEKWDNFRKFTYGQIQELMTDYGKIDLLWLDGGWVRPAGSLTPETLPWIGKNQWIQDVGMPAIASMAREKQPGILIVDRTVHGEYENYRTPEQQIPVDVPDYPWESCITLGDSWYSTGPAEHYKSKYWAIHTLSKVVAKGGNLLLGVGPDKSGDFVPEVYQRLKEIGDWMRINGEAIYKTKTLAPYQVNNLCFTQSESGNEWYLIYLLNPNEELPDLIPLADNLPLNHNNINILGTPFKASIVKKDGKFWLKTPAKLQKNESESPALVFKFQE
ncbi:MAG: alpha-L-fucosidase [Bacteroidetes bacterium]|nr:MAG: alpha-L-fucosidase [Bacteroidota bacterium]